MSDFSPISRKVVVATMVFYGAAATAIIFVAGFVVGYLAHRSGF